ncbi:hypothetical protein PILCRDRAFT_810831 [Piloderma croceum F 1598]|uniref:Uncharacterized protein n=1 Tax=Piloderma croceum (strain F 1598) TaxID=765440 RepID=A0A0C3GIT5_PILCF|nr:hypothetical protein PILCRDRAFT_810831 [Piloderma croceum F 1598]
MHSACGVLEEDFRFPILTEWGTAKYQDLRVRIAVVDAVEGKDISKDNLGES